MAACLLAERCELPRVHHDRLEIRQRRAVMMKQRMGHARSPAIRAMSGLWKKAPEFRGFCAPNLLDFRSPPKFYGQALRAS